MDSILIISCYYFLMVIYTFNYCLLILVCLILTCILADTEKDPFNIHPDTSFDPCNDFYKYSCQNFHQGYSNSKDTTTIATLLKQYLDKKWESSFYSEEPISLPLSHPSHKAKAFFRVCMNNTEWVPRELLMAAVRQPMDNNLKTAEGRTEAWSFTQLYGVTPFFNVSLVKSHTHDTSKPVVHISQPLLSMPLQSYNIPHHLDAFSNYLSQIFNYFWVGGPAVPENIAKRVIDFEKELASIMRPSPKTQTIPTAQWVQHTAKLVHWDVFLNRFNIPITEVTTISAASLDYFSDLISLIDKTSAEILQWYTAWVFFRTYIPFLPKLYIDWSQDFLSSVHPQFIKVDRTTYCKRTTESIFHHAMVSMLYDNELQLSGIEKVVESVRESFMRSIQELEWMEDTTKKFILGRIQHSRHVLTPEMVRDKSLLENYYKELYINEYFVATGMNWNRWKFMRQLNQWRNGVETEMVPMLNVVETTDVIVNEATNEITYPLVLLLPPIYSSKNSAGDNYGRLGALVGQALSRMIGIQPFSKQLQCFENQQSSSDQWKAHFSFYDDIGVKVSLNAFMAAQNGGIAKRHFRRYTYDVKNALLSEKQFFISFAQLYCQVRHDEVYPGKSPVIKALSNLQEFGRAFNCPVGSTMNPLKKCQIV